MRISKYIFKLILILFLICIFTTCKKDKIQDQPIFRNGGSGPDYYEVNINYYSPCFNPNNYDEFIFIKANSEKGTDELIKHSLSKNSNTILLDNIANRTTLKWSKSGWIVFSSFEIYRIRENGDSLMNVTSKGNPNTDRKLYASFTKMNDIFYYFGYSNGSKKIFINGNKIINPTGGLIDSVDNQNSTRYLMLSDVNSDDVAAGKTESETTYSLKTYDIKSKTFNDIKNIKPDFPNNQIRGIGWDIDNQNIIYSIFAEGIFRININTGREIKLSNGGNGGGIGNIAISPDGKKIIFERQDFTLMSNGYDYLTENNLFIIDIDGNNLKKLIL